MMPESLVAPLRQRFRAKRPTRGVGTLQERGDFPRARRPLGRIVADSGRRAPSCPQGSRTLAILGAVRLSCTRGGPRQMRGGLPSVPGARLPCGTHPEVSGVVPRAACRRSVGSGFTARVRSGLRHLSQSSSWPPSYYVASPRAR